MRALFTCLVTLLLAVPAQAQFNFVPEIRGGIFARGVDGGGDLLDPDRIGDANVELVFAAPDLNTWMPLGELRPHIGATLSLRDQDSYGYAGLSWTVQAPVLPVFVEASAGGVVRSSAFDGTSEVLGCGVGLRVAGSAGLNLPLGASIMATVEHLPDFGTCDTERDNTNVGVRLGFRF